MHAGRILAEEEDTNARNRPLHTLCLNDKWDRWRQLFIDNSIFCGGVSGGRQDSEMLPLHYAPSRSLEAIKVLLHQFPESVQKKDFLDPFPFHGACRNGTDEVVRYLDELLPKAIAQKTITGDLPLHMATGN